MGQSTFLCNHIYESPRNSSHLQKKVARTNKKIYEFCRDENDAWKGQMILCDTIWNTINIYYCWEMRLNDYKVGYCMKVSLTDFNKVFRFVEKVWGFSVEKTCTINSWCKTCVI